MKIKLECIHADTCLPDYWPGHHLPHVQVAVHNKMTIGQLRQAIRDELRQGYVMGSSDDARLLSADWIKDSDEKRANALTAAAYAAVNRDVTMRKRGARYPFKDIESSDEECCDSVCAYFVFREV